MLLGIACSRDVAIPICTLKELQAFKDYPIKAVSICGACKTTTQECTLRGCC